MQSRVNLTVLSVHGTSKWSQRKGMYQLLCETISSIYRKICYVGFIVDEHVANVFRLQLLFNPFSCNQVALSKFKPTYQALQWLRHDTEALSVFLTIREGNPHKNSLTWKFDILLLVGASCWTNQWVDLGLMCPRVTTAYCHILSIINVKLSAWNSNTWPRAPVERIAFFQ